MKRKPSPEVRSSRADFSPAIEVWPIGRPKPNPRNARTHTKKQIAQIARSIAEFGFTNPILVDREEMVVAGHGRLMAARDLNLTEIPVVRLDHLTPEQVRAYVIADNKLALNAGWDQELLAIELEALTLLDTDFDVTLTGFEIAEIDVVIEQADQTNGDADRLDWAPPPIGNAITRPGDLWLIGAHRLLCGDARDDASYARLMGEERAQMVFCDPPYNVPVDGHVCGLGSVRHREFSMASGEMSKEAFTQFLREAFERLAAWSTDGSLHYHCIDWRHVGEMLAAGEAVYDVLKNLCVWAKTNAGMGSMYRSQHELVLVFKSGGGSHVNNIELGRHGRFRTNVWNYPGANGFSATRQADLADHPTVKPVALVADAVLDATRPRDVVLDAFAGSGTTLAAAQKTRRRGFGMELDPTYCDAVVRRLGQAFALEATHADTGKSFSQMAAERGVAAAAPARDDDDGDGPAGRHAGRSEAA